ncbi:hypothetical protein CPB83DRAFT_899990 [Crepidotus variabilis]|uniref:Uncharacterized protein n=1 Tax=Crepidotus variabilis TaxID=179855 RepID=A0A9P6E3U0_9AGAR|nr:hypothetical protein CPB83DRAFT_899990 [Crepidotus variabilis]
MTPSPSRSAPTVPSPQPSPDQLPEINAAEREAVERNNLRLDRVEAEKEWATFISAGSVSSNGLNLVCFWGVNEKNYPLLFCVALDVLPVQASAIQKFLVKQQQMDFMENLPTSASPGPADDGSSQLILVPEDREHTLRCIHPPPTPTTSIVRRQTSEEHDDTPPNVLASPKTNSGRKLFEPENLLKLENNDSDDDGAPKRTITKTQVARLKKTSKKSDPKGEFDFKKTVVLIPHSSGDSDVRKTLSTDDLYLYDDSSRIGCLLRRQSHLQAVFTVLTIGMLCEDPRNGPEEEKTVISVTVIVTEQVGRLILLLDVAVILQYMKFLRARAVDGKHTTNGGNGRKKKKIPLIDLDDEDDAGDEDGDNAIEKESLEKLQKSLRAWALAMAHIWHLRASASGASRAQINTPAQPPHFEVPTTPSQTRPPPTPPDYHNNFEEPFPDINSFLQHLSMDNPERELDIYATIFEKEDYNAACLAAPPFSMTQGNADFLAKELKKKIDHVHRIRAKDRAEAKRARRS